MVILNIIRDSYNTVCKNKIMMELSSNRFINVFYMWGDEILKFVVVIDIIVELV